MTDSVKNGWRMSMWLKVFIVILLMVTPFATGLAYNLGDVFAPTTIQATMQNGTSVDISSIPTAVFDNESLVLYYNLSKIVNSSVADNTSLNISLALSNLLGQNHTAKMIAYTPFAIINVSEIVNITINDTNITPITLTNVTLQTSIGNVSYEHSGFVYLTHSLNATAIEIDDTTFVNTTLPLENLSITENDTIVENITITIENKTTTKTPETATNTTINTTINATENMAENITQIIEIDSKEIDFVWFSPEEGAKYSALDPIQVVVWLNNNTDIDHVIAVLDTGDDVYIEDLHFYNDKYESDFFSVLETGVFDMTVYVFNNASDILEQRTRKVEFVDIDLPEITKLDRPEVGISNATQILPEEKVDYDVLGVDIVFFSPEDISINSGEEIQIVTWITNVSSLDHAIATINIDKELFTYDLEYHNDKYESEFFTLLESGDYNITVYAFDEDSEVLADKSISLTIISDVSSENKSISLIETKPEIEILSPITTQKHKKGKAIEIVANITSRAKIVSTQAIVDWDEGEMVADMYDLDLDGTYESELYNVLTGEDYELSIIVNTTEGRFNLTKQFKTIKEKIKSRLVKEKEFVLINNRGSKSLREALISIPESEFNLTKDIDISRLFNENKRLSKVVVEELSDSVEKIEFNNISTNGTLDLGVKDLAIPEYEQSFAIDPEAINFTNATVTITAKGTRLYKCKEWDYDNEVCYGEWVLFKDNLEPGKTYNFTLTPDDPAFGEKIDVIDLQSYPVINDIWAVRFQTYGTDQLVITPSNGTTWSGSDADLELIELMCGDEEVSYNIVDNSLVVNNYYCNETSYERSKVLTTGPHTISFTFGGKTVYAKNKATDKYDNVSLIYSSSTALGQSGASTISVDVDTDSVMFNSYYRDGSNSDRLYFNESDLYKVSYGCSWIQNGGSNRAVLENWIELDGTEVSPSRSTCYTRDNLVDQNRCSNSGTLLVDITKGEYIELKGEVMSGGGSETDVLTYDDCWVYAQKVKNRVSQYYDNSGGQDIDSGAVVVDISQKTYNDIGYFDGQDSYINITQDGWYKTSYESCAINTGQNGRITLHSWLRESGTTDIPGTESYAYIRDDGYGQKSCTQSYTLTEYNASDYIELMLEKSSQENNGVTTTVADQSWLLVEKIDSDMISTYDSAGSQSISDGVTAAINLDSEPIEDSTFTHSSDGTSITVNENGLYEISYSLGWQDDGGNDRVITCAYLRINGSTKLTPSQQCDYSRGDTQALWNSVSGTVVANLSNSSYIELVAVPTGSAITTMADSVSLSMVKLDLADRIPPKATLLEPSDGMFYDSWPVVNVTFNCSAKDNEELAEISLYLTDANNESFALNQTTSVSGKSAFANWTLELEVGNYTWNCLAKDATNNVATDSNRTFSINFTDIHPPVFNPVLIDQYREYTDMFYYDVNATDNHKFDSFSIDNTYFTIDEYGLIRNVSLLDVGEYSINITANDTYSNTETVEIIVTIQDTVMPKFTSIYNATGLLGSPLSIQYVATDLSGIKNWSVNDTTNFKISEIGLLENATVLVEQLYYINVSVVDPYDNMNYRLLTINITNAPDTENPIYDPELAEQFSEYNTQFVYDINATDNYAIDTYLVNDSRFSIDLTGILRNVSLLEIDRYVLLVTVNDTSGNINASSFLLVVNDTTGPSISYLPNITHSYQTPLSVQLYADDASGIASWSINDSNFVVSNTGLLQNASLVGFGNYSVRYTITDNIGNSNNFDRFINVIDDRAPWFTTEPIDQYVEFGDSVDYDTDAIDNYLFDSYAINDSRFTIDSSGTIKNASFLDVGTYPLRITINDTSGNYNHSDITIYVQDTVSPTITETANTTAEYYSEIALDMNATDLSGIKNWSVDSGLFTIDTSGLLTNLVQLPQGEHYITVTAYDYSDNTDSAQILINITPYTGNLGWNVQQGQTTMTSADTFVDINEVNTDHAFILISVSGGNSEDEPENWGIWAEFVNETRFVLHQDTLGSNVVGWQVIENPQIRVQQYNATFDSSTTAINIPLSKSYDTDKTIVFISSGTADTATTSLAPEFAFTGEMTSSTNARLKRDASGTVSGSIGIFVAEFNDGSFIQSGEITNVGGLTTQSYIDLSTKVNPDESWVYFTHASDSTANGLDDFGIQVTNINGTRWEAKREATGGTKRMRWYVIETPGANVQRGTEGPSSLSSGQYPSAGFNAVEMNKTIALLSWYNTGAGTTYSNYLTSYYLSSTTQFTLTRGATGNSHSVTYEIIEFPIQSVAWNTTAIDLGSGNWSYAELNGTAEINSTGANTNVVVRCVEGNCSQVITNYTTSDFDNLETKIVEFTCLNNTAGNISAIFELSSSQAPTPERLNVTCEITPDYHIHWNTSSIDLGQNVQGGLNTTTLATIVSEGINKDTVVVCTSGDCAQISTNYTTRKFIDEQEQIVEFEVNENETGIFSATFNLTSNADETPEQLTISWEYTENVAPSISLVSPLPDTQFNISDEVNISVNALDSSGISKVYANITWGGGSAYHELVDLDGDDIYETLFVNTNELGIYGVEFFVNDTYGNRNDSISTNFTVADTTLPNVTLAYPENNYLNNTHEYVDITFNATIIENVDLVNCSLWHNISGTWSLVDTNSVSGTSATTEFTLNNLKNTSFIWNIGCYDVAGNLGFALENRSAELSWLSNDPIVSNLQLTSESGLNISSDNLTCAYDVGAYTDALVVDWLLNSSSIAVANYPFEGNLSNAILDYSSYSNDIANVYNQATWSATAGHSDTGGYTFDGTDDWLQVSDSSSLDGMEQLTIETWVYSTTSDTSPRGIVSKRLSSASERSYSLFVYTGRLVNFDIGTDRDTSTIALTADAWHHVVVTFDGSLSSAQKKFYIDGQPAGTGDYSGSTIPSTASDLHIGSLNANYGASWMGNISEVRIYDKVLTEDQILSHYLGDYNELDSDMTAISDNWQCVVTPFSETIAGTTEYSNTVSINKLDYAPNVTLDTPAPLFIENQNVFVNLTFNATVADDWELINCSLWHNYSGMWSLESTVDVSGTSDIAQFNMTDLTNKTFIWNIECYDDSGRSSFAEHNRTVILDLFVDAPPVVLLDKPEDAYINDTHEFVNLTFNATATDDLELVSCSLWHNYSGVWHENDTMVVSGNETSVEFELTNLNNKTFIWNIECTDNNSQSHFAFFNRSVELSWVPEPIIQGLSLTSTSGENKTYDNLTCSYSLGSFTTTSTINWYLNDSSLMLLNMPFEGGIENALNDYSGLGANGTNYGATWSSTGDQNGNGMFSFTLSESDYILADSVADSVAGKDFTLLAWIRSSTSSGQQFPISFNDQNGDNKIMIGHEDGSSNLYVYAGAWENSGQTFVDGDWHLVGYRFNDSGNLVETILDGYTVDSIAFSQSISATDTFALGMEYDGATPGDFFEGDIGEVIIYEGLLSDEQLVSLFNNGQDTIVSQETDLFDRWKCGVIPFSDSKVSSETMSNEISLLNLMPSVSLISPTSSYSLDLEKSTTNLTFNATASDDYSLVNCSLWHNISGVWALNQTTAASGSSQYVEYDLTGLGFTEFIWNIGCYDSNDVQSFGTENRTVTIVDAANPLVTDVLPVSSSEYTAGGFVNITANVTDNDEILIVQALIEYPGGSDYYTMLDSDSDGIYNTSYYGFVEGRVNITIIARDMYDNVNNTESTWINISYSTSGAIYCAESPCIADSSLIYSRGNMDNEEPNFPNTIDDCTDGTSSGTYQSDESVENITIRSLNGSEFRAGDTVEVNISVYCYSTPTSDNINFVYANDTSPTTKPWKVVHAIDECSASGFNTYSTTFVLDDKTGIHGMRGIMQYNGNTADTCGGGTWDDNDDLEFLVLEAREFKKPLVEIKNPLGQTYYYGDSIPIRANMTDESDLEETYAIVGIDTKSWRINLTDYDFDDIFTGTFSQTTKIGNYSVSFHAIDSFNNKNESEESWFLVNDTGTMVVDALGCVPTSGENGTVFRCSANISDANVPLDMVVVNLTYSNTTTIQPNYDNVSDIFNITFTDSAGVGVYTVLWWANNTNGIARFDDDTFKTYELNKPLVSLLSPIEGRQYNTSQKINLSLTVTDDIEVDYVWAIVTLPDETQNRVNLTQISSTDNYFEWFRNTRQTGNYSIQFFANDTSGNINNTITTWINFSYVSAAGLYCEESPCIADSSLIYSRGNMDVEEPNFPNTIDSCTDGTSAGTYQDDESVENITIRSLNGSEFRAGDTVEVNISVHCFSTPTNDNINFVYANDTSLTTLPWRVIYSDDQCDASGFNTYSTTLVLDNITGTQAIRGIIQYNGDTADTCGGGTWDDNDDVEFLVKEPREKEAPRITITSPESMEYVTGSTLNISALITDDTSIEFTWINVSWNDEYEMYDLTRIGLTDDYSVDFSNTSYEGEYMIRFYANDTFNNLNDTVTLNFTIGGTSYSYYYGTLNLSRVLGYEAYAFSIFQPTQTNLIILATDNQSSFNIADLQALGRTKTGTVSINDFSELDTVLDISGRSDNFENLWSTGGSTPAQTTSFTIEGTTINNVPIVESINNSNFYTGVLWDTADSVDAEFDGSEAEDIIFITKQVNPSTVGTYGTYGYEMRIPGNLTRYISPYTEVGFYVFKES